jgi:hypothetical protein
MDDPQIGSSRTEHVMGERFMVSWKPQEFLYLKQEDKWFRFQFNCSTAHEAYRNYSIDVKLESDWKLEFFSINIQRIEVFSL